MTVKIETDKWMRPTMFAEKHCLTPQQVSNRIASGELKTWYIKELRLTLVSKSAT